MHLVDTSHTTFWLENHDPESKKRVLLSMKIEALIVDVKGVLDVDVEEALKVDE
ncbi:hypothetical protein VIGAN_01278900 [Vigna angularis var. angularis]|uniref:Uncharacterized protein n=1 Tax=Vigna angularis var. angularis TaxID=157739 RepID=A0A0S3R312_PHAAN|nr:hypothetical protein VIGAN_01278900 [Vigna angularis var. angularis]